MITMISFGQNSGPMRRPPSAPRVSICSAAQYSSAEIASMTTCGSSRRMRCVIASPRRSAGSGLRRHVALDPLELGLEERRRLRGRDEAVGERELVDQVLLEVVAARDLLDR